jgi:protocatechuate 3,4-dioxygenase beta subunit
MIPTLALTVFLAQAPAPSIANQTAADRTARFEGQVISATTGDPLKKATVELRSTTADRTSAVGHYVSATDAQGHFLFEEVQPGSYALQASRVGYVTEKVLTSGPISTLKFVAGQKLTDFTIKLTPQGSIYGRITDEDGDPVRETDLELLHWTYQNGRKELRPAIPGSLSVDDDGTFVIGYLPAGRYYLRATHQTVPPATPGRKNEPQEWYIPTYFPNSIDASGAASVQVSPGVELRGIDIRLRKARVFRIRGSVAFNLGGALQNLILQLTPKDGGAVQNKSVSLDGTFEIANVLPGAYTLEPITTSITTLTDRATGEVTRTPPLAGRVALSITDSDLDSVRLIVTGGAEVTGKIRTEDPLVLPANLRIRLHRGTLGLDSDQYKSDGTFRVRGLAPDEYRVIVFGLPDGVYVKLVKFGEQDITHKKLDLSSGAASGNQGADLEITLSPNAAEITGVVRNEKGDAIADSTIQLTRDDDAPIPTVSTDQNGAFHLRGLAPGDYRIYAWQDDGEGIIQDPDFRGKFAAQCAKITLAEKAHETVELKLITKDAMAIEAAKLP